MPSAEQPTRWMRGAFAILFVAGLLPVSWVIMLRVMAGGAPIESDSGYLVINHGKVLETLGWLWWSARIVGWMVIPGAGVSVIALCCMTFGQIIQADWHVRAPERRTSIQVLVILLGSPIAVCFAMMLIRMFLDAEQ